MKLKVPSVPAVMGSDYGKGNLHWNDGNCSSCSRGILGKLLWDNQGDFVQMAGRMQQDPGDSWPGNTVGLAEAMDQLPWGSRRVPGRGGGALPALRCLVSPPASAAAFFCPNSKALSVTVPVPWAFSTAGSCSRVPLEQFNTTGMALLLLLLPCQGWE